MSDYIYDIISQGIINGTIKYGERLNIKDIAQELRVSPMPVRDAIKRLETEEIVIVHPRSTCYVKIPTQKTMLEAFEMRLILEVAAAEKIYPSVTAGDLRNLKYYLDMMESSVPDRYDAERMKVYVQYDTLFHNEICLLAKNTYLMRSYRFNTLHLNIALTFGAGIVPDLRKVENDHRQVYEYLTRNDGRCVDILRRHLVTCRNNMTKGDVFRSLA